MMAANVGGASCTAADGSAGSVRTAFKFNISPGRQGLSPPEFPFPTSLQKFYSGMEATLTEQKICLRRMTNPAYAGDSEERLTNSYLVGGFFGRVKVIAGIQPLGFLAPGNECKALALP